MSTTAPLPTLPTDPVADPRAVVQGATYRITVLTEGLLRLEHADDGRFEDRASTFALNRRRPVPDFHVTDTGTHLVLTTDRLRLTYDKAPFSTSGLAVEVLGGITTYHSVWRYGQRAPNLGGTARTLDWADGAIPLEPGVVAAEGFAVLDDSASLLWDADGWVAPRDGSREDLYVFAYGHDYGEAVRALYAVSGPAPVVPRWALGNWWSRYHPYTADEYAALLDRFAADGIPFSVAVLDMDWHVRDVDPRYGSGWTGYTWNTRLFPDPRAFLRDLHERGLRVTLNDHPADGVQPYEESYPAMARALGKDPAGDEPIAFDVTDRAFLAAYFDVLHRRLEADGVDFWWVDWQSGPYSRIAGIDPLWVLNHFHYLDSGRDRPPLTFSRYAGPGSHRYPVGFSGDTVISWASLAFQPYFTATAANIGYGWWSHDIGGHFFGAKDDELATRWVQLGVFSPILRLHSSNDPFTTKEPWTFGPAARQVQTRYLRLRHRLVPYLHTMNHRAAAEGVPLVVPLYHAWPDDEQAYNHPTQFVFGSQLLVAPITSPGDRRTLTGSVRAWLPEGTWVDVLDDVVYDGGREVVLHRDLGGIPVLARLGAVVPLDAREVPPNDPVNPEHLEVLVVTGADGSFELVEDDAHERAAAVRTPIRYEQGLGRVTAGPARDAAHAVSAAVPAAQPASRSWTLTFLAADVEADVVEPSASVDGAPVPVEVTRTRTRLSVTVNEVPAAATLVVDLGGAPALAENDVRSRLYAFLEAAQIEYQLKTRILQIATSDAPLHVRVSHLHALGLDTPLVEAVDEILLAHVSV